MNHLLFRIAAILSLLLSMAGSAQAQAPVPATGIRVLVYGIHYGGNIVYNYKVVNNGEIPFNNFTIGSYFDNAEDYEYPQLIRRPFGWKYGITGETGREIILAPSSTSQPPNWKSWMYGQQDTYLCYLEWHAPRGGDDVSNAIRPGQSLAGFSVTIPLVDSKLLLPATTGSHPFTGPDEMYLKGNFKVGLVSGKDFQEVWGSLEREDTTPPSLTVSLSPNTLWPPNGKLVPVTATITVKDDYDPAPEVKLESIFVNETAASDDVRDAQAGTDDRSFSMAAKREGTNQAGRVYTVTYSATDGSGNKVSASATVTVPHDQGGK